jgi:hypothetical protein
MKPDNESLADKLKAKQVFEEFVELMFGLETEYADLLEQLEKWGISSSMGALSRFKASHLGWWSMERAKKQERDFLTQHGANLDEVTRNMIAVRIFQAAANPNTTNKDVLKIKEMLLREAQMKQDLKKLEQELALKTRALDQKDEQIELLRRRIEAAEAKLKDADDVAQDDALSAEEKALRWKQIFGR